VPINPFFFQGNRTTGVMLVSLAGPIANLLLAIVIAIVFPLLVPLHPVFYSVLPSVIYLNIYLAIFNLVPIPPLDGSKIVAGFLPKQMGIKFLMTMERYGFLILMVLALTGILATVINPIASTLYYGVIHFILIFG